LQVKYNDRYRIKRKAQRWKKNAALPPEERMALGEVDQVKIAARMQNLHKFAQFLKQRFFHAAQRWRAWAVCTKCTKRGRFSAQARRGASARKGGRQEGISFAIRRLPGAHVDG
jgi:hypothetical protein